MPWSLRPRPWRRPQSAPPVPVLPEQAWVFRSSLGAGMKMPTLNEITATVTRSITVNANTPLDFDSRGNPNLKPERSINFEAVAERYLAQKAGVISANVYVRATSDFTERRLMKEGARWVDRPYNEGDALHYGFELDGKINTDQWGIAGGTAKSHLTLPNARVDDTRLGITRNARDTPKYVLSMGWDQKKSLSHARGLHTASQEVIIQTEWKRLILHWATMTACHMSPK